MILHRIIRLVFVFGAGIAPIWSALFCRFISRLAVKQVIPLSGSQQLPMLTQTWIAGVADGSFPLLPIALFISGLVFAAGLYYVFSQRLSPQAAASALVVVCCIGYALALMAVCSTTLALVMPFLKMAPA